MGRGVRGERMAESWPCLSDKVLVEPANRGTIWGGGREVACWVAYRRVSQCFCSLDRSARG